MAGTTAQSTAQSTTQPITKEDPTLTLPMRLGLGQFNELTDEKLAFIKQLGADDFLMNTPRLPGDKQWDYDDLLALRQRADAADLRLMALENVPVAFYDKAMLGLPGRDEQIAHMQNDHPQHGQGRHSYPGLPLDAQQRLAHARAGRAARRRPRHPLQPGRTRPGRTDPWPRLQRRRDVGQLRLLPGADPACGRGGRRHLALHPDDPPVPSLGGVARIFRDFDGFKRAMDTFDSPNHGLDFCMGCWSEMGGMESVIHAVRHFGERGKIIYVHFRDVQGAGPLLQRVLHRRGQRGSAGGDGNAQGGRASPAS